MFNECKISSGSVQKMDPVEQTAGRLGFRKNRRARLAVGSNCRGTEQVIRQVTGRMTKCQDDPAATENQSGAVILCADELMATR